MHDPDPSVRAGVLDRVFRLRDYDTSVRTELGAGLTTFLTMAYIVFVNPAILADAGMPREAVFVATCLVAAFGSLVMALYANYPVAVAPGMGLNAFFAYTVVQGMGYSWQAALGAVFISGCCFLLLTLTGLRRMLVGGIPRSMRLAITAGIGMFLGVIALKSAGIVVASPATLVTLGDLRQPSCILAIAGFLVVAALTAKEVRGALLLVILAITAASFLIGGNRLQGIAALPPSLAPTFFAMDLGAALGSGLLNVVLVLFLVELFDATGTLVGVAERAGLLDDTRRFDRALSADSAAVLVGSLLGTSSATAYVESAAGVEAGGRTGLTAAVVAVLFLACLFFAPIASAVPGYATAPALFYVACLMLRGLGELDWSDLTEVVPAAVTMLLMPFTFSIANGIACGFITYAVLKLLTGRGGGVKPVVWIVAALFLLRFFLEVGQH